MDRKQLHLAFQAFRCAIEEVISNPACTDSIAKLAKQYAGESVSHEHLSIVSICFNLGNIGILLGSVKEKE